MDINCNNMEEHFELLKTSIASCEFLCIDTEFTGNKVTIEDKCHEYDTYQDKYRKSARSVKLFQVTQVGLTTFVYSAHKRKYIGRPFNINLCQRSIVDESSDAHYFNMNAETIAFLRKHHFDFNHQLKTGLSFYQLSKKADLRQRCKAFVQKLVRVSEPVKEPAVLQTKGLSLKNKEAM